MLSFTAQKVRPLMCRFLKHYKHYLGGGFAVSIIWEPIKARRWLTMAGCGNPKGSPFQFVPPFIWALPFWGGVGLNPCPDGLGHFFREDFSKFKRAFA